MSCGVAPTLVTSTLQFRPKPRERLKYAPVDEDVLNPPEIAVVRFGQLSGVPGGLARTTLGNEVGADGAPEQDGPPALLAVGVRRERVVRQASRKCSDPDTRQPSPLGVMIDSLTTNQRLERPAPRILGTEVVNPPDTALVPFGQRATTVTVGPVRSRHPHNRADRVTVRSFAASAGAAARASDRERDHDASSSDAWASLGQTPQRGQ